MLTFLKTYGDKFNLPIFSEVSWLSDNYGPVVFDMILQLTKDLTANPPGFFKSIEKREKKEERQVKKRITALEKVPSLQKIMTFIGEGKERKYEEVDIFEERENKA